jgi:(4S)-4-hydroxy-5-phosphonooxypentane-2,3-dione isomerase
VAVSLALPRRSDTSPGTCDELRARLLTAVEMSRTEPGNLLCLLMEDPQDDHRFSIFEIYRDDEAIKAHQAADYTKESAPIIHALFAKPMEVQRMNTLNWPDAKRVTFDLGTEG